MPTTNLMTGSQLQAGSGATQATATAVPLQGAFEGQLKGVSTDRAVQGQADADIFDALFSKWGSDAAAEEANIGSSFDDLLWDEGTAAAAAAAAAAASLGWQRSFTPLNLLGGSRGASSDQQQQLLWDQLLQQQLSNSLSKGQPTCSNSCSDAQGRSQPAATPAASVEVKQEPAAAAGGAATNLQYSVQAMQQLLSGNCVAGVPASSSAAAATPQHSGGGAAATAAAATSRDMLNAFNTAQQQLNMQQQQLSAAFEALPVGSASMQVSMPEVQQLQQQMQAAQQQQQQQQQFQQLLQQQQPQQTAPMSSTMFDPSVLNAQGSCTQQQQQLATVSSWPPATAAAGCGSVPNASMISITADPAVQLSGQQQLQQQQVRPAGMPMGLPFSGAGPGPGPGFTNLVTNFGVSPGSTACGYGNLGGILAPAGANIAGDQAALHAAVAQAAQQQPAAAAWLMQMMQQQQRASQLQGAQQRQQQQQQQQTLQLQGTQQPTEHAAPAMHPAAAAVGSMGPPNPHACSPSAPGTAAAATAAYSCMLPLPQQRVHAPPLHQPILTPELFSALGLDQLGNLNTLGGLGGGLGGLGYMGLGAVAQNPSPAGFNHAVGLPPGLPFPASMAWQLQLAGLLRPPALQATGFLQLAMIMQAAMQASALSTSSGGGDTQQAALVLSALQGLAGDMRMVPPCCGFATGWQQQQQPQQQQVNGSCLANAPMLHRQLPSSYAFCGPKPTLQFGSAPQTSTTELSALGMPGCHSHSTAVAAGYAAGFAAAGAAAAAAAGVAADGVPRSKPKRKVRHNYNRARYEGRKARANNRVRVKGRFVKVGPDGEIIMPAGMEAEADHTAVTHSDGPAVTHSDDHAVTHSDHNTQSADHQTHSGDHDVSDITDTGTNEHPGSSMGRSPDTVTAAVPPEADGEPAVASGSWPVLAPAAAQSAEVVKGADAAQGTAEAAAAAAATQEGGLGLRANLAATATCLFNIGLGSKALSIGAAVDAGASTGLADDGRPMDCCTADQAAAGLCTDCREGIAAGDGPTKLPSNFEATAMAVTGSQHGCKRPSEIAASDGEGRELLGSSINKRKAVAGASGSPVAAAADYGFKPVSVVRRSNEVCGPVQPQQQAVESVAAAAAAVLGAGVVNQQDPMVVDQTTAAVADAAGLTAPAAAEPETAAQAEAAAEVPDVDTAMVVDTSEPAPAQPTAAIPAAAAALPAQLSAGTAPGMPSHSPAAALLQQLVAAAGNNPVLQQMLAAQAGTHQVLPQNQQQRLPPVDAVVVHHLPGDMHPPADRPPAGVWGHHIAPLSAAAAVAQVAQGACGSAAAAAHVPAVPHAGQLSAALSLLAGQSHTQLTAQLAGASAPAAPGGVGALNGHGNGQHMGMMTAWTLQQQLLAQHLAHNQPNQQFVPAGVNHHHHLNGSAASGLAAALPLLRAGNTVPANGQHMFAGPLMPVALPGGWPLAAAVAGKWVGGGGVRQRRRAGKTAKEGSEQTDSCLN